MPNFGSIIDAAVGTTDVNELTHPIDMEPQLHLMDQDSFMYLTITRKLRKSMSVKQMKHEYRERRLIPNWSTVKTNFAANATTIYVNDPTYVKVNRLVYFPKTGDLMMVTAVNNTTGALTVVKVTVGSGGIAHAGTAGDAVLIGPHSLAEGGSVPAAYTTTSVNKYDYVMQSDRAVASTDIEDAVEHYDEREKNRNIDLRQAYIEYERDENLLHYVGQSAREIVSASGRRRHCMSGLFERLVTNKIDLAAVGGVLPFETLVQIMAQTVHYGQSSQYKIGIFGTNGWNAISAYPKDAIRTTVMGKTWGMKISRIVTGYGDMEVAHDPVLSAKYGLADRGVVIDPKSPQHIHLQGLKVRIFKNKGANSDIHNTTDVISGTFGQKFLWEEMSAQVSGIGGDGQ